MKITFFAVFLWPSQKHSFSRLGWVLQLEEDVIHFRFTLSLYVMYLNYHVLFSVLYQDGLIHPDAEICRR